MTASQIAMRSVSIPVGHILVDKKYQGSSLAKTLKGSVNVTFEDLHFLDFRTAAETGIIFLNESVLIGGNAYKQRIVKLAKLQTLRGVVLYEKTELTMQYCESLQKFTTINVGLNLYPVTSQSEVAQFLIQLVNVCGSPRSNPFLMKRNPKPSDQALLDAIKTVPGLGEKRALALLQSFPSVKDICKASKQDLTKVVGDASAESVKTFFSRTTTSLRE